MDLVQSLKKLLADLSAYRIKTQYYHWNIEGPDFMQYHSLLGDIYEKAHSDVDDVAEHIRALDAYAPGSFKRFAELTTIADEETVPTALEMITRTYADNQTILESARAAHIAADAMNDHGQLNFIEGLIDEYEKQAWMLRATIKR